MEISFIYMSGVWIKNVSACADEIFHSRVDDAEDFDKEKSGLGRAAWRFKWMLLSSEKNNFLNKHTRKERNEGKHITQNHILNCSNGSIEGSFSHSSRFLNRSVPNMHESGVSWFGHDWPVIKAEVHDSCKGCWYLSTMANQITPPPYVDWQK